MHFRSNKMLLQPDSTKVWLRGKNSVQTNLSFKDNRIRLPKYLVRLQEQKLTPKSSTIQDTQYLISITQETLYLTSIEPLIKFHWVIIFMVLSQWTQQRDKFNSRTLISPRTARKDSSNQCWSTLTQLPMNRSHLVIGIQLLERIETTSSGIAMKITLRCLSVIIINELIDFNI